VFSLQTTELAGVAAALLTRVTLLPFTSRFKIGHYTINIDGVTLHFINIKTDSTLLSGFPFIGNGDPDNNLESLCI
jgi:hypothetical protein